MYLQKTQQTIIQLFCKNKLKIISKHFNLISTYILWLYNQTLLSINLNFREMLESIINIQKLVDNKYIVVILFWEMIFVEDQQMNCFDIVINMKTGMFNMFNKK